MHMNALPVKKNNIHILVCIIKNVYKQHENFPQRMNSFISINKGIVNILAIFPTNFNREHVPFVRVTRANAKMSARRFIRKSNLVGKLRPTLY